MEDALEKTMAMGNACFFALAMNAARPFGLQKEGGRCEVSVV